MAQLGTKPNQCEHKQKGYGVVGVVNIQSVITTEVGRTLMNDP